MHILRTPELLGCLEYDLMAFLHVDIKGLFAVPRTLTYRQVCVYLRYLPGESALSRRGKAGDPEPSVNDRLSASIINGLRILDYHFVSANSKKPPNEPDLILWEDDK